MRRINGRWTAQSPISHNADTNSSTTVMFRTAKVIDENGQELQMPIVSGNSIRHSLRDLGMADLMSRIGVEEKSLAPEFYYCLFSGGHIAKGASGRFNQVGLKTKAREFVPVLSIFGSAFGAQTMDGKIDVGIAYPLCKETQRFVPENFMEPQFKDVSFWSYRDELFYTRHDNLEEPNDITIQMKYDIECLAIGTPFWHEIVDRTDTELEGSALRHMIELYCDYTIAGGKSGTGHGKIKAKYELDKLPDTEIYLTFVQENKNQIDDVFKEIAQEAGLTDWRVDR